MEFEGAVYHVMARGNERRSIFRDDRDRKRFLETLVEMVEQYGVRVHAYCLMPNHYHLLVETPRGNLSQAVGWLQVTYTVRFNRRHRRSGHLFQGRFKAQVVDGNEYGQWLVEYVHLNPVRPRRKGEVIAAERAAELDRYEWSSHRDYAGMRRAANWLCLDWLRYWGETTAEAQWGYHKRIAQAFAQGVISSPWERIKGGLVLGGEPLWSRVSAMVGRKQGLQEAAWSKAESVKKLREAVGAMAANETDERIKIWAQVRLCGERKSELARALGYRDGSGVAYVVRRVEADAQHDKSLARKLNQWKEVIYALRS